MNDNTFHGRINDLVYKILTTGEHVDSVVVEGYDCVGKGRVVSALSSKLNLPVYQPDYSFLYDYLPREYRGIVNWSYFDIMRKVYPPQTSHIKDPVIFDRGMISAAVYNKDTTLLEEYKKKIEGYNVVHVLVTALNRDHVKFSEARGQIANVDKYTEYTGRFFDYFVQFNIPYLTFINPYEEGYTDSSICKDCKSYEFPNCLHKKVSSLKSPDFQGCKYFVGVEK